jgi:hypothetical protein
MCIELKPTDLDFCNIILHNKLDENDKIRMIFWTEGDTSKSLINNAP